MRPSILVLRRRQLHFLRRSSIAVAALAAGVAFWGCDDDTRPGPPGTAAPTGSTTGSATGTGGTGGGSTGGGGVGGYVGGGAPGGGGEGGSGASGSGELGPIPHEDVPDTACAAPGGTPVKLYDSGPSGPSFRRLVTVGSRRAAGEDSTWGGFVTFDANGSNPDGSATTIGNWDHRLGSEGSTLGLAANTLSGDTVYRRFDDTGTPAGAELTVASNDAYFWLQIASGESESLVVWGTQSGTVRARGIDSSGALAGSAFDIDTGAFTSTLTTVAARRSGGFAVAWSGDVVQGSEYAIRFATTSLTGVASGPVEITRASHAPSLVRMVKTPTGYALLLSGPLTASPYVLILGESGSLVGPAHRLVGAVDGWDIAAQGSELGVLAPRATAEPEFRAFDASMTPLADWVCLAGPSGNFLYGGLDADGAGYAAVYFRATTLPQGEQMFVQVDRLGTGP